MASFQNTKSKSKNASGTQNQSQFRHTWPQSSSAAAASSSSPAPVTRPRTIQFAGDILEDWLLFERNLCCYGPLTRAFVAEELDSLPDRGRCASSATGAPRGRGRVTFLQQGKEEHNVRGALKRRVRSPSPCPRVLRRRLGLISRSDSDSGVSMTVPTNEDESVDEDEDTASLQLIRMNAHSDAISASSISEVEAVDRWVSEHQERWFRDQLYQFDLRQRQLRSQSQSQPQAQVGGPVERERGRTGHIWSQSHYQVSGPRGRLGERERSGRGRGRMSSRREACWVVRGEDSE
jgi:hypothetical protein